MISVQPVLVDYILIVGIIPIASVGNERTPVVDGNVVGRHGCVGKKEGFWWEEKKWTGARLPLVDEGGVNPSCGPWTRAVFTDLRSGQCSGGGLERWRVHHSSFDSRFRTGFDSIENKRLRLTGPGVSGH